MKDMDYTMSRENRRLPGVFPGKRRERGIDLIVAVDTSGSINYNDYNDFVNQIEKISKDCELNKVRLIQCHHTIAYDAEVNLSRIKKLGIVETGGTTMRCVFEKLKRENNKKLLILFTDGAIDSFDPKEYAKFKHIMFTSRGNRMYGENLQKQGFTVICQDEE
jgi:predicted metal-dependent peptidase